ncbi:MAG: oligoendopeptidase F, partial [Pseudomonadota bacterium]
MFSPLRRPELPRDADASSGGTDLGTLPDWDLTDLYPAIDAPELEADFERMQKACSDFGATYEGKLADLDGDGLARAIMAYEAIDGVLGRIMSFAGLLYQQNTQDMDRAKFMGDAQARVTDITQPLVFFSLELNKLGEDWLAERLAASPTLARYKPWIDRLRALKPYQLSDELEKFLHDQSVVGSSAWNRLFDETMAGLTFNVEGHDEPMGLEATLNLLSDSDRAKRKAGGEAVAKVLADNIRLFTRITNTLAKEKEIEDRWRSLPAPDHGRHLANQVEPEVVD